MSIFPVRGQPVFPNHGLVATRKWTLEEERLNAVIAEDFTELCKEIIRLRADPVVSQVWLWPDIFASIAFTITEAAEVLDAVVRRNPAWARNRAKESDPQEEAGDLIMMILTTWLLLEQEFPGQTKWVYQRGMPQGGWLFKIPLGEANFDPRDGVAVRMAELFTQLAVTMQSISDMDWNMTHGAETDAARLASLAAMAKAAAASLLYAYVIAHSFINGAYAITTGRLKRIANKYYTQQEAVLGRNA